jgi:hypothetical protein
MDIISLGIRELPNLIRSTLLEGGETKGVSFHLFITEGTIPMEHPITVTASSQGSLAEGLNVTDEVSFILAVKAASGPLDGSDGGVGGNASKEEEEGRGGYEVERYVLAGLVFIPVAIVLVVLGRRRVAIFREELEEEEMEAREKRAEVRKRAREEEADEAEGRGEEGATGKAPVPMPLLRPMPVLTPKPVPIPSPLPVPSPLPAPASSAAPAAPMAAGAPTPIASSAPLPPRATSIAPGPLPAPVAKHALAPDVAPQAEASATTTSVQAYAVSSTEQTTSDTVPMAAPVTVIKMDPSVPQATSLSPSPS